MKTFKLRTLELNLEKKTLTVNGKTVSSMNQLIEYLSYYEPGEEVELTVQVPKGTGYEEETIKVTLDQNTSADDSENKDSKKDKNDQKDSNEDTDSQDSEESNEDDSENPFIEYFQSQGFFR